MTTEIDQVFGGGGDGNPGTSEVTLTKAADLIRGAVSKAVAEGTTADVTKAVGQRAYHLTKALNAGLEANPEATTIQVDTDLLKAVETDAADAVVTGSMSEAMDRLAKAMTPAEPVDKSDPKPDKGGEPPAGPEREWPSDLNDKADPDGLDEWGADPDLNAAPAVTE